MKEGKRERPGVRARFSAAFSDYRALGATVGRGLRLLDVEREIKRRDGAGKRIENSCSSRHARHTYCCDPAKQNRTTTIPRGQATKYSLTEQKSTSFA